MADTEKIKQGEEGNMDVGGVEEQQTTGFYGRKITPENRNKVKQELIEYFLEIESVKDYYKDFTEKDIELASVAFAKLEIIREQKHYKAWVGGKKFYQYRGRRLPVLNNMYNQDVYHSDLQKTIDEEE